MKITSDVFIHLSYNLCTATYPMSLPLFFEWYYFGLYGNGWYGIGCIECTGIVLRIYWHCIENVPILCWVGSDEYKSDYEMKSAEKIDVILIDVTEWVSEWVTDWLSEWKSD